VEIAPPPAPTGALQWLAPFLPTEVRVREMLFQRVNATIPMGTALAEITAENVRAVEENQTWALSSRGGKAEIPGLPKLDFISHQGRASRTQFSLSEAEFRVQNQGKIKASGDIPFGGENPAKLRLELDQVPVTPFLPEDWRARLTGDLTGTLNLTQTGTDSSLLGHLRLLNGKLEALPILRKISDFTRMPEFLSLRFKQAEGDVEWKPDSAHVRNLSIEAENLLRVTGDLGRDAEALSGQLRLGVTPTALQYVPGARDKVFVEQTDQYVWTPVVISGTADNPQEDLTGRLAEAALGTVKKTVENAVEELKSKAGDAVNSLYDFLRGPSRQIPTPTPTPSATEKSSAL
jgi:hypothetical protein